MPGAGKADLELQPHWDGRESERKVGEGEREQRERDPESEV